MGGMGLPAKLLGQGEYEVLHLRTHAKCLVVPAFVLILTAAVVGVGWALLPATVQPVAGYVLVVLAVIVFVVWVLVPFLRWRTTTYTVTNRRIITRRGILSRTGHDLPLMRINDVSYQRSVSDRILGCGTLLIETASENGPVVLPDVPAVEEVHVAITELLFGDDDDDQERHDQERGDRQRRWIDPRPRPRPRLRPRPRCRLRHRPRPRRRLRHRTRRGGSARAAPWRSPVSVRVQTSGDHLVELIMDRPSALNAISTEQAAALAYACADVATRSGVRAVVISSALPTAFCVGADLKERAGFSDDQLRENRVALRACFAAVRDLSVPVVAAVDGYALGGGCELALSADLIVAGESATFALPEVGVGLIPGGGGTQLLTRRLGYARAADLILTGRRVDAAEAYRLGLVDRLTPAGESIPEALALATLIAERSPIAVRAARQAMRAGGDVALADGLELEDAAWRTVAFSPDRVEGIAAFVEKRSPSWIDAVDAADASKEAGGGE